MYLYVFISTLNECRCFDIVPHILLYIIYIGYLSLTVSPPPRAASTHTASASYSCVNFSLSCTQCQHLPIMQKGKHHLWILVGLTGPYMYGCMYILFFLTSACLHQY